MASWFKIKLTKWQVDKMPSWQIAKLMKNGKLTKLQVGELQVGKMASWQNAIPLDEIEQKWRKSFEFKCFQKNYLMQNFGQDFFRRKLIDCKKVTEPRL